MQTILIENQNKTVINGAIRVLSSTTTQAVVEIENNNLILTGKNIEVTKLDLENKEVIFDGEITALKFAAKTEKTNFIKRLFK